MTPGQREEPLPTSPGRCVVVRLVVGDAIAVLTGVLSFSAKLRDETDLDALSNNLVGMVRETMQPSHVSVWLRPDTAPKGEQAD